MDLQKPALIDPSSLNILGGPVLFVDIHEDLFISCAKSSVQLWSNSNGNILRTFEGHKSMIVHCIFNPNGDQIATCSRDDTVKLWQTEQHEFIPLTIHASEPKCSCFSPDSTILAVASGPYLRLFSVENGDTVSILGTFGSVLVTCCAFNPDGSEIVIGLTDGRIELWKCQSTSSSQKDYFFEHRNSVVGHSDSVTSCSFHPTRSLVLTSSLGGELRIWDTHDDPWEENKSLVDFVGHKGRTYGCFNPSQSDGVVSCGRVDQTIRLWSIESGECNIMISVSFEPLVCCVSASTIVSGGCIVPSREDDLISTYRNPFYISSLFERCAEFIKSNRTIFPLELLHSEIPSDLVEKHFQAHKGEYDDAYSDCATQ